MSFQIQRHEENGLSLIRMEEIATGTSVDILPTSGALLHRFNITTAGNSFNIIDNYKSKDELENSLASSYKSSKLSPFVCRIAAGQYKYRDEILELSTKFNDGTAIHGLLYNKEFQIIDEFVDDESASIRLRYHYKKEDAGYPFDYRCEVRYVLHADNVLQIETTIINLDDNSIPVADGWHPYFKLGGKTDDWIMQLNSDTMLEFNEQLIPTGKMIYDPSFKEPEAIGDRQFDNCFLLQVNDGLPVCVLHNPQNNLTLGFYTNSKYPYLQIYTPPHRESIAIENLSAAPDCFNNGMGLLMLGPRQSETFNVWYKISC